MYSPVLLVFSNLIDANYAHKVSKPSNYQYCTPTMYNAIIVLYTKNVYN